MIPDLTAAAAFLKLLDPSGRHTFQTFHDVKPPTPAQPNLARIVHSPNAAKRLIDLHARGAGVYVTVQETDMLGRKSEHITRVRAVFQEDDNGFTGDLPLEPSFVVQSSPGKFHRYWFVADDWPADEQGRTDFANVMDRMVETYGSDGNAKDIARVLRVPGFLHRKDGKPHLIKMVSSSGRRYTRDQILKVFPPVVSRKPSPAPAAAKLPGGGEDIARIEDALRYIAADDRDIWLQVGMALKDELDESGRATWDDWSKKSAKYDATDQDRVWKSFCTANEIQAAAGTKKRVTIATLFGRAIDAGWKDQETHRDKNSDTAELERLAKLSTIEYERERKTAAEKIGIDRVAVLDKLVRQAGAQAEDDAAALPHWNVEPWDTPVSGAALLTEIAQVFARHIVLPKGASDALALWTLHAWTVDAGDISPFLVLISPTKRCGKTSVLIILMFLTPRSELASNISASAIFRYVEDIRPTLLIDEADSFMRDNEEMRGILNSGHTKAAAHVIRNVEVNGEHKARRFSTWAPKAVATIQALADTLEDRAIVLRLQRKPKTAKLARLRRRDNDEFATLRRKAARWAEDNFLKLNDPEPETPATLNDRAADNWQPLLGIAEIAGGEWPSRAREAACVLSGEGHDAASANVELLADIKLVFGDDADEIRSADLVARLIADPERPWAEWKNGKPLTQKTLAGLLGSFGIISGTVHPPGLPDAKGYKRGQFQEAWEAYVPGQNASASQVDPFEASKRPNACGSKTSDAFSIRPKSFPDGSKNDELSYSPSGLDAWTDRKPEIASAIDLATAETPCCAHCRGEPKLGNLLLTVSWEGKSWQVHERCVDRLDLDELAASEPPLPQPEPPADDRSIPADLSVPTFLRRNGTTASISRDEDEFAEADCAPDMRVRQ